MTGDHRKIAMLFDVPGNTVFVLRVSDGKIAGDRDCIHLMGQGTKLLFKGINLQGGQLLLPSNCGRLAEK